MDIGIRVSEVPCLERSFNSCGSGPFCKNATTCPFLILRGPRGRGNYYCTNPSKIR